MMECPLCCGINNIKYARMHYDCDLGVYICPICGHQEMPCGMASAAERIYYEDIEDKLKMTKRGSHSSKAGRKRGARKKGWKPWWDRSSDV